MARSILIGTSVRVEAAVFRLHLERLKTLRLPPAVTTSLHFIIDSDDPALPALVTEHGGTWSYGPPRAPTALYTVDGNTHGWNDDSFDHIARCKDLLIEKCISGGYSHMLFVDSDLMLDPSTLWSALSCNQPIVSSVFWTEWVKGEVSLGPNVWLKHPYGMDGLGMSGGEFWRRLANRRVTEVAGGGACILIEREVLERGLRYYPRIPDLPDMGIYRGEDRSFCIRAKRLHATHVCDPWPDIIHCYHPEDRKEEELEAIRGDMQVPLIPQYGDLINFTVAPLEEPNLAGNVYPVRGRLGALETTVEIETALLEMKAGESRILEIIFPMYWPHNAGQKRLVQLLLIDRKPYGYHPVLANHVYRGILGGTAPEPA